MSDSFVRAQMLLGEDSIAKLKNSRVAIFGVGGVGGFTLEALVRSGVGKIDLIDDDVVCESNLNRQIIATTKTLGMYKVDAAISRALEINPDIKVIGHKVFYTPQTADLFDFSKYDYVIDAIDTVTGKIELIMQAEKTNTPIISSMGAGNKLDPTAFTVTDIYKTSFCPLARVMRRELKKRGVKALKVVYSTEEAMTPFEIAQKEEDKIGSSLITEKEQVRKKQTPGSVAFVPSVAGLIVAGEVIKDLLR